ncbi:metallophosphoesterase family protein [Candidatus Poriferisocius sp.]|uniref:metallophosphoesterase family protein n=1 Tax=Candidatus Poriferisocius sp. TaxID=3101276 RepID=UPI003B027EAB
MVKFLHTADWQLGMTRHFLAGEAQARFDGARIDVIRRIGALAVDEGCGFVVVCGDVFESNQVNRQVILRAFEAMGATLQVTFYLLPGNHDPLDASSVYMSPTFTEHKPDNVVVLGDPSPVEAASGVELVPAPWFTKRPLTDLVADVCDLLEDGDAARIVVGHGAIDTLSPDKSNPALISLSTLEERIERGQIHYVALGDRHSTTDEGPTGRVWYSGAPEPTDYDEVRPGNVLVVELETDHIQVQERPIGDWRFLSDERELTSEEDLDNLEEWLDSVDSKERTIVKLALIGQISLAQKARLDRLLEHHSELLAALETWERRSELVVVPDDTDLDKLELSGFAREAAEDLSGLAESGEQAVVARDALALLHRLAGADS